MPWPMGFGYESVFADFTFVEDAQNTFVDNAQNTNHDGGDNDTHRYTLDSPLRIDEGRCSGAIQFDDATKPPDQPKPI